MCSCFSNFSKLIFTISVQFPYIVSQARWMWTSPVLLLCKLCSSNASVSVKSRNNILLNQILFFPFFISLFFHPSPSSKQGGLQQCWNFLKAEQHYIPLQVFHMFHSRWKSSAVENHISTCCLWKCCLCFAWERRQGPYLMFLRKQQFA